jgi:hypothetical protein
MQISEGRLQNEKPRGGTRFRRTSAPGKIRSISPQPDLRNRFQQIFRRV